VVRTAGTYAVYATDINNCVSSDTFKLLNIYPLPIFNLGNDTTICPGLFLNLNAGNFFSYLWNNNTSNQSLIVSQPGQYSVRVTDQNGCSNSDTLSITGFKEVPTNFLPNTLQFCENEPVELKASKSYVSYRWNTGSTQPFIKISSAGAYWLEVENSEGCKNSDTTYASKKECYKVLYFPTAFTPNADGKNDTFRPKVFGDLTRYNLTIYTRLGEKVFETTEPSKGWDGKVRGVPQQSQTFVWASSYQFTGADQKVQVQKGSVTLIK
jgi:gliding motility-associated-like protein